MPSLGTGALVVAAVVIVTDAQGLWTQLPGVSAFDYPPTRRDSTRPTTHPPVIDRRRYSGEANRVEQNFENDENATDEIVRKHVSLANDSFYDHHGIQATGNEFYNYQHPQGHVGANDTFSSTDYNHDADDTFGDELSNDRYIGMPAGNSRRIFQGVPGNATLSNNNHGTDDDLAFRDRLPNSRYLVEDIDGVGADMKLDSTRGVNVLPNRHYFEHDQNFRDVPQHVRIVSGDNDHPVYGHILENMTYEGESKSAGRKWRTVYFRFTLGNRTVNVRRFIRKHPAGFDSQPQESRPLLLFAPAVVAPNTTEPPARPQHGLLASRIHQAKKKLAKFLSLFTIIKFSNDACMTAEGVNGTCYHHLECKSMGGIPSGTCAQGYGVCCYFQQTCGTRMSNNCSYFVNPGYPAPSTDLMACLLTVDKLHPDVSQLRLDFIDFELMGPTDGTCIDDQFIVSGQNTNSAVPMLCGNNNGNHMYVDVDASRGPFQLSVMSMGGRFPRKFKIKVCQLKPGNALTAPPNCLQYHTGVRGTIQSFNYDAPLGAMQGYMNNLNYAICIRKEDGFCSITYTTRTASGTDNTFQFRNVDQEGDPTIPPGQAGAEVFNCPDDYIVINGVRLCGERLNDASIQLDFTQNAPVTDTSNGPFLVPVRTNGNIVGRGFKLQYMQNKCQM